MEDESLIALGALAGGAGAFVIYLVIVYFNIGA